MKRISTALMFLGLVVLIQALTRDIGVTVYGGRQVANVGLMHDRLIMMILSGFIFFGGLVLRLFGASLASTGGGFLLAIDELPTTDYWLRITSALLVSGCVWLLLVMHFWSSTLAFALLLAAVGWFTFQPNDTYLQLKRLWLVTLILVAALAAFQVFVFTLDRMNYLTIAIYTVGVDMLGSTNPLFNMSVMIGSPLALSISAFLYMSAQVKVRTK